MHRSVLALLFASVLLLSGCAVGQQTVPKEKSGQETNMDGLAFDRSDEEITYMDTTDNVIYLAGGCFWGMEQLMQSIPGVIDAESGYANGTCEADANYKTVCKGETGFRETVRVEYDPEQVSLDALLLAYFYVIDPTVQNRQGNDRGSQYQTGVYYTNESARETVKRIAEIEQNRSKKFFVEIGPLKNYYPAEEYIFDSLADRHFIRRHMDDSCIDNPPDGRNQNDENTQAARKAVHLSCDENMFERQHVTKQQP